MEQAVAASIKAIFILLGDSDIEHRQDPISFDKLEGMVISYANKVLGQIINTRRMDVETPPEFITDTINEINKTWHQRRQQFTLSEAEIIAGRLGYIAETNPWLKILVSHLYTSITAAISKNKAHQIHTSADFRSMLKLEKNKEAAEHHRTFAQSFTARTTHRSPLRHDFNRTMKEELRLIVSALSAKWVHKRRPIAHMIPRDPTGTGDSDSSLSAAGGYSFDMKFWWYLEWPPDVRKFTLKFIKNNRNGDLISINVLEYAALIINYVAATHFFTQRVGSTSNPTPTVLLFADNTTAES